MTTLTTHTHHDHDAGLGATADLINTLELVETDEERLPTSDAAIGLPRRPRPGPRGRPPAPGRPRRRRLARARPCDARAAIRELWDANVQGRAPDAASLAVLNDLLDRSPRVELRRTLAGVEVAHRHPEDDPTGEALARAATPLVEAIAAGTTDRLRICANDECRWVFADASRAGRRRWCDMASCGNQAKVRRFRAKRREGSTTGDAGSPA